MAKFGDYTARGNEFTMITAPDGSNNNRIPDAPSSLLALDH